MRSAASRHVPKGGSRVAAPSGVEPRAVSVPMNGHNRTGSGEAPDTSPLLTSRLHVKELALDYDEHRL
jgi:hypothetical protein